MSVRNTGSVAGAEVVQLYVRTPGVAVTRAVRELRAFERVELEPGESATVQLEVAVADLAYYDEAGAQWVIEPGSYSAEVGPNAGDLLPAVEFTLAGGRR